MQQRSPHSKPSIVWTTPPSAQENPVPSGAQRGTSPPAELSDQQRAIARHLRSYPDHDVWPEVGAALCVDCDAYVWRDLTGWRLLKWRVKQGLGFTR